MDDIKAAGKAFYFKLLAADNYTPGDRLSSPVLLIRAGISPEDDQTYGLTQVCDGLVEVMSVEGDHQSFITANSAARVSDIINKRITSP